MHGGVQHWVLFIDLVCVATNRGFPNLFRTCIDHNKAKHWMKAHSASWGSTKRQYLLQDCHQPSSRIVDVLQVERGVSRTIHEMTEVEMLRSPRNHPVFHRGESVLYREEKLEYFCKSMQIKAEVTRSSSELFATAI